MVITMPRLGNTHMAMRALFDALGIACVIPDNNRAVLQRGAAVAPEDMCLPFKIMMGGFLDAIEQGADTVLLTGSCGPCRFGEYGELFGRLLKQAGHEVEVIVIDAPSEIGMKTLLSRFGLIAQASRAPRRVKLLTVEQAYRVLVLADAIDAAAHKAAGYEREAGACGRELAVCRREVCECRGPQAALKVLKAHRRLMRQIETDPFRRPLRVAIAGEVYSMFEPFANLNIEERLMRMGVSTERLLTPTWWLRDLALKPLHLNSPEVKKASGPYLPVSVGGHARETIAHAVRARQTGMDGVIQIFPMGCMPEIVAKAALHGVELPVLTLVVDEMTGDAGYDTRIEAFLDMLEARRRRAAAWA
jgi:predicted nucleotide-binding protein (sugar kinase/HSP70/actin superfamily)